MTDTKMAKIADKIQKLLALAGNNPSEEEAQAALLKAQELMAEYSISEGDLSGEEEIRYEFIVTKVKSHKWNDQLGVILANSFACRILIYDNKVAFFGRADNAQAVASAMEFAFKVMKRGGDKATRDNGYTPGRKGAAHYYNSYVIGFLEGLKASMDAQTVALAIVVPADVNEALSKKFHVMKQKKQSHTKSALSADAYNTGKRDGSTVMDKRTLTD